MLLTAYQFAQMLFMFFLFCNIGWVQESTIESLYHRRPINRGFLHGPYIPIYGVGGLAILFMCMPFKDNGFMVYFVGLLGCTVLEYFVGWLLEKIFHKQFWDYSMLKFTYKNRISLLSSLFWGLLSLFMVYVLYGIIVEVVRLLPYQAIIGYDLIMTAAMVIDTIYTVSLQLEFRKKLKNLPYDKAKKLVTEKFIQLGGAVLKRRQRFRVLLSKMKFTVDDNDEEHDGESDEDAVMEEIR